MCTHGETLTASHTKVNFCCLCGVVFCEVCEREWEEGVEEVGAYSSPYGDYFWDGDIGISLLPPSSSLAQ